MKAQVMRTQFVGIEEAAEILGVSYSAVWESLRRGDFPAAHTRIGTKWRISRPSLEALADLASAETSESASATR